MIMSGAKGKSWYCNSDNCWEGRQYELHIYDPAQLAEVTAGTRKPWQVTPSSLRVLPLSGYGTTAGTGAEVIGNVSGAAVHVPSKTAYIALSIPTLGQGEYRIFPLQLP
jgi:hypothetical protein